MEQEQNPVLMGIMHVNFAAISTILAVKLLFAEINRSFANFDTISLVAIAIAFAFLTATYVRGFNGLMRGRSQIKALSKAKYLAFTLNVVALVGFGFSKGALFFGEPLFLVFALSGLFSACIYADLLSPKKVNNNTVAIAQNQLS